MESEFNGIERRLDELDARLARLRPLQTEPREAFDESPYLWDRVYQYLQKLDDPEQFATLIRAWLQRKGEKNA